MISHQNGRILSRAELNMLMARPGNRIDWISTSPNRIGTLALDRFLHLPPQANACTHELSAAHPFRSDSASARAQAQALRWVVDKLLDAEVGPKSIWRPFCQPHRECQQPRESVTEKSLPESKRRSAEARS